MLCPLSVPHCSKTKYSILFIWPLLLKMPGVDQIGTNYLLKNYYRGSFPHFVWTLLGYCFLCRWFTKFTHDTFFSGNFSHEREFRDEVFVIAVNCTQSLSIPLVKKINKLRTIGESYPLSLFCKHPRKLSIDQAGNIEGTLCKSFKTRSGTITRITWSKTREII